MARAVEEQPWAVRYVSEFLLNKHNPGSIVYAAQGRRWQAGMNVLAVAYEQHKERLQRHQIELQTVALTAGRCALR